MTKIISISSKELTIMKPITEADYGSKTILTNSCWQYVELWLKRKGGRGANEALFYWQQAKHFYVASNKLPINSKPLTSYYCCLNAAKALLSIRGQCNLINISHGITQDRYTQYDVSSLEKAKVIFLGSGVLNELSKYFSEDVNKKEYSIKDLLYNIPCIHRAFCITYSNMPELFVPIHNIRFVRIDERDDAWIEFEIDKRYANEKALKSIPSSYQRDCVKGKDKYIVRREKNRFKWNIHTKKNERLQNLNKYHKKIRKELYYIYGEQKLWYLKKDIDGNEKIIKRNSITLIYAVMHWLSELVRYNPRLFEKYMKSNQNWLLHEFIENALLQFIDEIGCEITRKDIMTTGYRK